MVLPNPRKSFTIPSLHDGARLECRLYHPDEQQGHGTHRPRKSAVIAHPYAPLGGCFDDPAVGAVGSELLRAGCVVGTFNLRGAGESEGRTSWTAKPELGDYISFYGFLVYYLHGLNTSHNTDAGSPSSFPADSESRKPTELILAGYSYGSMLASYLPSVETVLGLFSSTESKPVTQEIISSASQFSRLSTTRDSPPKDPFRNSTVVIPNIVAPSVSYLLISPILPPISFLTSFSLLASGSSLDTVLQGTEIKSTKPAEKLTLHRSLAIYGDDDTFTSVRKLRNWSKELADATNSQFEYREVEGAGHFWQDHNAESQMKRAIREWVSRR